ncbi:Dual oxidase [Armadillidium vulgare]|nr:Dual oxidase [Armadillidium vulgare]
MEFMNQWKERRIPLTSVIFLWTVQMEGHRKVATLHFSSFLVSKFVEEVLDAQGPACPPEYFNIPVPDDHEYKTTHPKVDFLPLLRTRYDMRTGFSPNNPRQQLNEITPYIDGGLVYGTSKAWADLLRINKEGQLTPNGKLAWHSKLGPDFPAENTQRMPLANPPPPTNHSQFVERQYTANVDRFLKLGNPRGNENPFLLTFGIFWFRWHNAIAGFLKKKYPSWDGERIFNEARKWVIATQQSVTVYDWLPKYLKTNLKNYTTVDSEGRELGGYDPTTDPQISHIFQSAAMRFGHTLVPSGVYLRKKESEGCETTNLNLDPAHGDNAHSSLGVRTCNSFWRSPELFTSSPENFERFIMGMASQSTEEEDNIIVRDLRGRVFGPLEFSRRDLMAINIQRARDHGLPDYNTARKYFGLPTLDNLSPEEYAAKTKSNISRELILNSVFIPGNGPRTYSTKLQIRFPYNIFLMPSTCIEASAFQHDLSFAEKEEEFEGTM